MDDTKHDDQATDGIADAAVDDDVPSAQVDGIDTETETESEGEPAKKGARGWRVAAIVAVLAAATSVGVLGSLLIGGNSGETGGDVLACVPSRDYTKDSDPDAGDTCPPKGAKYTDGLVEKAEGGEFSIRSIEGGRIGKTLDLFVREPDRAYIDVQHAQTHAALGQPVRVFTKLHEGREIVIYMEDSPLLK